MSALDSLNHIRQVRGKNITKRHIKHSGHKSWFNYIFLLVGVIYQKLFSKSDIREDLCLSAFGINFYNIELITTLPEERPFILYLKFNFLHYRLWFEISFQIVNATINQSIQTIWIINGFNLNHNVNNKCL